MARRWTITRPEVEGPITVSRFRYRDRETGRMVTRETQRDSRGRFLRHLDLLVSKDLIIKTSFVPERGPQKGLLASAFGETNILTNLKNAERMEIEVQGKDARQKDHRFKRVIQVGKDTTTVKASTYLLWGVLDAMRRRGYRTQYNLEIVGFTHRQYPKSKSAKLKQLHSVRIVVRVFKR